VIKNVEDIDVFYDRARDVLYLSFGGVSQAEDAQLTFRDLVIRYRRGRIVGITVLDFSRRVFHQI
jgi:hypothetical protein